MADIGKRKISAKEMVADIRSGMDDAQLRQKYRLSHEALASVCNKLINAGAIDKSEIRNRFPREATERSGSQGQTPVEVRPCPSCNASIFSASDECPVCGIVLSKFVGAQTLADPALAGHADVAAADSDPSNRWLSVGLSIVVLAFIGVSLVMWAVHRDKEKWRTATSDAPHAVEEVDNTSDISEEAPNGDVPGETNYQEGSARNEPSETTIAEGELEQPQEIKAEPKKQVAHSRQPIQTPPTPPAEKGEYVTGQVRRFTANDFKKEVVEASKTYPVMFQFYSDT